MEADISDVIVTGIEIVVYGLAALGVADDLGVFDAISDRRTRAVLDEQETIINELEHDIDDLSGDTDSGNSALSEFKRRLTEEADSFKRVRLTINSSEGAEEVEIDADKWSDGAVGRWIEESIDVMDNCSEYDSDEVRETVSERINALRTIHETAGNDYARYVVLNLVCRQIGSHFIERRGWRIDKNAEQGYRKDRAGAPMCLNLISPIGDRLEFSMSSECSDSVSVNTVYIPTGVVGIDYRENLIEELQSIMDSHGWSTSVT